MSRILSLRLIHAMHALTSIYIWTKCIFLCIRTSAGTSPYLSQMCRNESQITLARKPCFATFAGFATFASWCDPSLGVSKRSVVELRGKDQQIVLAEYSRLVVSFLVLGQYLTQLWQVKGQIFVNSMIFQLHESMASKLSIVAA